MQESKLKIEGREVSYKKIGAGAVPVVLLHGWGLSSVSYVPTAECILARDDGFTFFVPDLPGFGQTPEPLTDWSLEDYVNWTEAFIRQVIPGGEKVILLGHSFGGRVAIKYAVSHRGGLRNLVLTGAAGIRHRLTWRQRISRSLAYLGKRLMSFPGLGRLERGARRIVYRIAGEKDYMRASERMQAVMRHALEEDLTSLLPQVGVPTLLIWGEEDHSTPLADGELMRRSIPGAQLFTIPGANHAAPYRWAPEFAPIFLSGLNQAE